MPNIYIYIYMYINKYKYIYIYTYIIACRHTLTLFCMHGGFRDLMLALSMH